LDVVVFRLSPHPQTVPHRPSRSVVIAWDWRRADEGRLEHCPEISIPSFDNLPASIRDIPVVVSGPRALAENLSVELDRPAYWLSVGGNGATDPQGIWEHWLAGAPSLSIDLVLCRDGKCQSWYGTRELRMHPSSPATSQLALLMASLAIVGQLSGGLDARPHSDAQAVPPARSSVPNSRFRSWFQSIRVSVQIAARTLVNRLPGTQPVVDQWVIGIKNIQQSSDDSPAKLSQRCELHWIEPGTHRFMADPFLVRVGETKTLFFEELLYSNWKGRLKALPLDSFGRPAGPEVTVLEKPYHLSFPFVFEHHCDPDALFLLPEQAASGNTVLYRSAKVSTPSLLRFEQDTVLLAGFSGIDPVVIEWKGHCYLFVTNGSHGNVDNNLQLFVSEALRGPYRAHPKSPIKLGLRGSRMAGPLFLRRGALYRPGQDCKARYGAQVILHRVEHLSPDDYREVEAATIPPDTASPGRLGSHTVVWYEGLVATDGLRQIPVSGPGSER
jgi:hypothetical protein